jgi:hypothetical protein
MRRRNVLLGIAATSMTLLALVLQGAALIRAGAPPAALPADLRDGSPFIWIFVRPGCPHCRRHLEGLRRGAAALAPGTRSAVLARIRLIGDPAAAPAGLQVLPAAWRDVLGVRFSPTTWLVDGEGNIVGRWLGPRDAHGWQRAFTFVSQEAR